MRASAGPFAVLLCTALLPAAADAQQQRAVSVTARGLFGDELLLNDAYSPVLVEVRNHTRRTLRGKVVLTSRHYSYGPQKHEVTLDLPPNAARHVTVDLFLSDGTTVEVAYVVGDVRLSSASVSPAYSPSQTGIVVLADPPRLRGALLDIDVDQPTPAQPYAPPGSTVVRMPVGVVPLDPATGDPMLPTSSLGWATTGLLVASTRELARVGPAEQQALTDWIRAGGQVLIFPRTDAELRDPFVQSLTGAVERYEAMPTSDQHVLVPAAARGTYYRGDGADFRTSGYGGSRRIGFGRVHVAVYDGTAPPFAEAAETRELVRSILSTRRTAGVATPLLPWGRRADDVSSPMFYGGGPTFGTLRAALDPNEGYRPALGLVAVVLLVYVLVIGPVNFTFIGKRNRPTLALITTPVAAIACLVVMLGVGYLGKGTVMRYRAVEIVELQEGDALGPARRYSGLFLTRPASFDLESPERGVAGIVRTPTGDLSPVTDHAGERPVVRGVRGRLWETVFVREERIADMGGGVTFDRSGTRLAGVRNGTDQVLRGVVVIDGAGSVYRVGTIAAGASAPVSQVAEVTLSVGMYWEEDPAQRTLASMMGIPRDRTETLDGAMKVFGTTVATPAVPVLFGWVEVPSRGDVAGTFGREFDVQFVRVVPLVEERVEPAFVPPVLPMLDPSEDEPLGGAP